MTVTPKRIRSRWIAGILAFWILGLAGVTVFTTGNDPTPTVYHHVDGTFSLNRKDGPKVTPDDVHACLMAYQTFGAVRLVGTSKTLLSDWEPIVSQTVKTGAASYRFEVDGVGCVFHVPIVAIETDDCAFPEIQLLNGRESAPTPMTPKTDVVIFCPDTTSCSDVVNATLSHTRMGKSVSVISETFLLRHNKVEHDGGAFTTRHSDFWNDHIQPWTNRLKSLF